MDASKNRRIYGVPVFPGDRPPTAPRPSSDVTSASVASAIDASLNGTGAAPAASTTFGAGGGVGMTHWKLRHVDFTPNLIKGKKEDEFERFP
jgi:hypothetical protein